ncbi:glucanase b [Ophiostoma piceae UAMH 11346]|uniref:Glucanase b n=1 Tax=Ophiostoma piceae (strain UAMH 11346) TaxID=1262450 RepID=S3CI77_OPHP1|nr:glucanase b [Ophiostoma piceae UAMH 11346]
MSTLDDCLLKQNNDSILTAPASSSTTSSSNKSSHTPSTASASAAGVTPTSMQIDLRNNTTSENVYAYVTGLDLNNNSAVFMLQSDGVTAYHPANPAANGTAISEDCAIAVGSPGTVKTVTIPRLAGARIWFCQDAKLTFLLNMGSSGPGLVEPSVTNKADPNYPLRWDFAEFTFNDYQMFANITYVDFISIPTALKLTTTDGSAAQTVKGIPTDGMSTIATLLQDQQKIDCAGWDQLIVQISSASAGTSYLRIVSPDKGAILTEGLFSGYYDDYVNQVWDKYKTETLTINTQNSWGNVTGKTDSSGNLNFGSAGSVSKPSAGDIFNCSSGAFSANNMNTDELANIGARIAAALNRSTLLTSASQPNGVTDAADYYQNAITNHYSRIVHSVNLDGRGYTFPYDDVAADGASDQAGAVFSSYPDKLTVYIGGGDDNGAISSAKARSTPIRLRDMARPGRQLVGGRRQHHRRSVPPPPSDFADSVDEKALLQAQDRSTSDSMVDLEKGPTTVSTKGESLYPGAATPSTPDLTARFALLMHQALVYMWAAICGLGRSAWALVPRRIAAPVGGFFTRVAESPAMAAVSSSVSSLVSSVIKSAAASVVAAMIIRPLVVRAVLTLAVLAVTYAAGVGAGASPALTSAVGAMSGWAESLVGENVTAIIEQQ